MESRFGRVRAGLMRTVVDGEGCLGAGRSVVDDAARPEEVWFVVDGLGWEAEAGNVAGGLVRTVEARSVADGVAELQVW